MGWCWKSSSKVHRVGATNAATQAASQVANAALHAANAGDAAITAPENHHDSK